jgi:hypothetical protein
MHILIIRHLGSTGDQHRCQVWRPDGKYAEEAIITAPEALQVEGRPDSNLSLDLRWYLEEFLDYPFPPRTVVAERVQASLKAWGEEAFKALFHSGRGRDFYHDAYRAGLENLTLKIASDDPRVLVWPWEALRDPQTSGTLAHHCHMERQLSGQHDPLDLPATLPRDRINILLITARPYEADVGFRALSRPLLDLIAQDNLPVSVEMLRPPTFDQLRTHLHARPGYYHIVHFDGHGGYGPGVSPDGYRLEGAQGRLLFETETGAADPVSADQLSALLREYRIPIIVLNACRSAMIDAAATDAFASVAAALQRAGVRSVVAMAYALYVSGRGCSCQRFTAACSSRAASRKPCVPGARPCCISKAASAIAVNFPCKTGWCQWSISKTRQTCLLPGAVRPALRCESASHYHRTSLRTPPPMALLAVTVLCWRWNAPCVAHRRGY